MPLPGSNSDDSLHTPATAFNSDSRPQRPFHRDNAHDRAMIPETVDAEIDLGQQLHLAKQELAEANAARKFQARQIITISTERDIARHEAAQWKRLYLAEREGGAA